jgi:predicted dehydrogenase
VADIIRAGIIGLDTSHVRVFTEAWNRKDAPGHVPGVQVAAAFPSFSPDLDKSAGRVEDYKKILSGLGVTMVASIAELAGQVDAILIESVDGRRHLPELRALVDSKGAAGKPVFIDKPMAASLADAKEMVRLVREHEVPCFSASSLRFEPNVQAFIADNLHGKVQGCDAFSPAHLEKTNPGFFWYGIHGVEILYTVMGPGCRSVRCTSTPHVDVAVGVWKDGRIGTMRGLREKQRAEYGAFVLCEKGYRHVASETKNLYDGLIRAITKFFQTKKSPMPVEECLEVCAFCQAAWESSQKDCGDVKIEI